MTNTPTRLYKGTPTAVSSVLFTATSKTLVTSITIANGAGEDTNVALVLAGVNLMKDLTCSAQTVTTISVNHVLENTETITGLFNPSIGALIISGVVIT